MTLRNVVQAMMSTSRYNMHAWGHSLPFLHEAHKFTTKQDYKKLQEKMDKNGQEVTDFCEHHFLFDIKVDGD